MSIRDNVVNTEFRSSRAVEERCKEIQVILDITRADFQRAVGEPIWPSTVLELARSKRLGFICQALKDHVMEEGHNPMHLEMATVRKGAKNEGGKKCTNKASSLQPCSQQVSTPSTFLGGSTPPHPKQTIWSATFLPLALQTPP